MTTSEHIRVAIIGCGLIGTEWDRIAPVDAPTLTHARAFSQNTRALLVALCDRDGDRARSAAKYWQVAHAYTDPRQLFDEQDIDVAVIATSSSARWSVIEPALSAGVKVLVIEKPLAATVEESRRLVTALDATGTRSLVNYSRNWDPSMRELKDRISAGAMSRVQRVVATYGKGICNNGSHMIDLTGFLCSAYPVRARALGSPFHVSEADWSPTGERAWDAQVELIDASGAIINLTLLGTDQRAFTCFELRVIGHKAMFELSMGGRRLNWTELQDDPNFAGYVVPAPAVEVLPRYLEAMQEMADEAVRLAVGDITKVSCDAHSALRTALAVEAIQRSAQRDGQWITLDTLNNDKARRKN
jgi:predicted dehydrogenase